jgi:hypothetical protein
MLLSGTDVPVFSIDKKKIKVMGTNGKELTLDRVGTHE